jgi:hypothetical protein
MILATVIEDLGNDATKGRGEHKFVALPSTGDRIVLGAGTAPWNDVLTVLAVEHSPVSVPSSVYAKLEPTVIIFAKKSGEQEFPA